MRRCHILNESVVNPETNETTDLPTQFIQSDKSATDSRWCDFSVIDRRQVARAANADPSQNAASIEETKTSLCVDAKHKTSTKNEDSREDSQADFTTEKMSSWVRKEGSKEGARLVA